MRLCRSTEVVLRDSELVRRNRPGNTRSESCIHLAAMAYIAESVEKPADYYER